jgi:ABC-2 type transport system permease protein
MATIARITWKDLLVIFRDRAALILMLGGPLLLTLGMGLVTGAFSGDTTTSVLPVIPVLVINEDDGPLGEALVDLLGSADLADLIRLEPATDAATVRADVAAGTYAALITIPSGFSAGLMEPGAAAAPIAIDTDPARPISGGVVESIVREFVRRAQMTQTTVDVTLTQLAAAGLVAPEQFAALGQQVAGTTVAAGFPDAPITVRTESARPDTGSDFNPLAYFAPAMALLFLMYTVTIGARSFLAERQERTLARMLVAPISGAQVLGGKVIGIFLSGAAQVGLLVGLSAVLFGLRWGNPAGVVVIVLAAAAAATGWGLLVASLAGTPAQVSTIGTTLMLSFGILGGSFVPLDQNNPLLESLGMITPNKWALDGFVALADGGSLGDLAVPLAALLIMAVALFLLAAFIFGRRQTALVTG